MHHRQGDPAPRAPHDLPHRITVRAAELPPDTLAWLAEQAPDPARKLLWWRPRSRDLLALAPGAVLSWWAFGTVVSGGVWATGEAIWLGALTLAAALALAFGAPVFHAALVAPLPRMKLLHSLYYVEVDDRVHFYPLAHLHDVAAVRRRAGAASTRTDVVLPFGGRARRVPFSHMDGADGFVQEVLRRRHLSLQPGGAAQAGVTGIDLVPARFRTRAARDRRRLWQAGGAVAAAAIAFGAAAAAQAREVRTPVAALPPPALAVRVQWSEAPGAAAKPQAGAVDCPFAHDAVAGPLTRALQEALDRVNGEEAVRLVAAPGPAAGSLDLVITARPGASFRSPGAPIPAIGARELEFAATLRAPGAAPREVRGTAFPPANLVLHAAASTPPSPEAACDEVRTAQLAGLAREIAAGLELEPASAKKAP
jgi:hypothetical protein